MAYYTRTLDIPFDEAKAAITRNLQQHGFGIITTIDLQDTFKKKLSKDFRRYCILGACNPEFAYKAISLESHMGVMLPCNVVIQEHEDGKVEISAINPLDNLDESLNITQVVELARDVNNHLRAAIDELAVAPKRDGVKPS
jgi:uncharacterized protein (DUF302 family)